MSRMFLSQLGAKKINPSTNFSSSSIRAGGNSASNPGLDRDLRLPKVLVLLDVLDGSSLLVVTLADFGFLSSATTNSFFGSCLSFFLSGCGCFTTFSRDSSVLQLSFGLIWIILEMENLISPFTLSFWSIFYVEQCLCVCMCVPYEKWLREEKYITFPFSVPISWSLFFSRKERRLRNSCSLCKKGCAEAKWSS